MVAAEDRLYLHLDGTILSLSPAGELLGRVRLSDLGITGRIADMQALKNGDLLLGDRAAGTIHRCSLDQGRCRVIASPRTEGVAGLFSFSADESGGRLYLADNRGHRLLVQEMDKGGLRPVTGGADLLYPNNVWAGPDGLVRVADTNHHRIVALDVRGLSARQAGDPLPGKNDFGRLGHTWPVALTPGPDRSWWVLNADGRMNNADVIVYDHSGRAVRRIALPEDADPFGLAWTGEQIVLTDDHSARVYSVSPETGEFHDFGEAAFQAQLQKFREERNVYRRTSRASLAGLLVLAIAALVLAGHLNRDKREVVMERRGVRDKYQYQQRIRIKPWPTEIPLFLLILMTSIGFWLSIILSMVGFIYALFFGLFLFISHLGFITYLRGSAVRLGPDQFPELYGRIEELSGRAGLQKVPEAYLMQAGGALNALATKFLRSKMIVLFSDLLDACGENAAARDMIIGHELGHIRAGHVQWLWFIFPGLLVPFLGTAYSQAREYTCDRYGAALCGDSDGALRGLTILAAGGREGPKVNLAAFAAQRRDLNTGLMTLGKWLGTHPPLCDRVAALNPALISGPRKLRRGRTCAVGILVSSLLVPITLSWGLVTTVLPRIKKAVEESTAQLQSQQMLQEGDPAGPEAQVRKDLASLAKMVEDARKASGRLPSDETASLSSAWASFRPRETEPFDPFDGNAYGYSAEGDSYVIWSAGPDGKSGTDDDLYYSSEEGPEVPGGPLRK